MREPGSTNYYLVHMEKPTQSLWVLISLSIQLNDTNSFTVGYLKKTDNVSNSFNKL